MQARQSLSFANPRISCLGLLLFRFFIRRLCGTTFSARDKINPNQRVAWFRQRPLPTQKARGRWREPDVGVRNLDE